VTDEHYCRPADGANHYLWKDIFILLRQLQIHDKEKTIYEKLRAQFMLHLRSLGLAPIELPKGFIPVNSNNTPEEKEQQYAFGEAWSLTRNWLEEKGFRTNLSSRTGLYIWPTPFSEISDHKGLHHILISPYEKIKTRHIVDFDPPVLDFTVSLEAESKNKIFSQMREVDRLDYLDLPLLIGDLKKIKHGPRILFATPLTPLLESDDLPKVLLSVTKEIYNQFLIPMF
ncbi:MAG: hypothetical protein HN416_17590, partial [Nitrospina sp.]|nr:hypothetical protein [Nitrospina sp.]